MFPVTTDEFRLTAPALLKIPPPLTTAVFPVTTDELRVTVPLSLKIPPPTPLLFPLTLDEFKITMPPNLLLIAPPAPFPLFPLSVEEFTVTVPPLELNPERYASEQIWANWPTPLLYWTAVLSAFPNYLALLTTRWEIERLSRASSPSRTFAAMSNALVLTVLTIYVSVGFGFATEVFISAYPNASAATVFNPAWSVPVLGEAVRNSGPFFYLTVCLWSGFGPALWSLLYGLSAVLLRAAQRATTGLHLAWKWFDVDKRPVRVLGFVAVVLWTLSLALAR